MLSPQLRMEYFNRVELTQLDLSDHFGTVGFDQEEYTVFEVVKGVSRLYDYDDDV